MAICVFLDASGFVREAVGVSLNDCTGFVLLDKSDWISNGLVQSLITIPAGEDFAAVWAIAFTLPCTIGLIAWAVSKIVHTFY